MVASTAWVWLFPVRAVFAGAIVGVVIVRRRSRMVDTDDSIIETEEASR
jgi:cytochrome c-type biogenesis protein CcmH/NrfF